MGKIENAIEKLNNDIQKHPEDQYRALVGEHLIVSQRKKSQTKCWKKGRCWKGH